MQNKPFRKCALPPCAGLRYNLVHKFPRRQEKLQQWLDAIGSVRLSNTPQERLSLLWICCRHFRVEDYVNPKSKTLNAAAVPSLNLKKLNDLDKCRQGEVEKAAVLTAEEVEWIEEANKKPEKPTDKPPDIKATSGSTTSKEKLPTINNATPASIIAQVTEMKNRLCHIAPAHVLIPPSLPLAVASTSSAAAASTAASTVASALAISVPASVSPSVSAPAPELLISTSPSVSSTVPLLASTDPISNSGDESSSEDFTLFLDDGYIEINDFKLSRTYELNSLWLRSQCHCLSCYDMDTLMPKINIFDLPTDVQPIMANVSEGTTKLEVVWDDGHTSTYDLNKTYAKIQAQKFPQPPSTKNLILWKTEHTILNDDFKPMLCYDILLDANVIPTALRRLQKTGVLVITSLPRSDTDSMLKRTLIAKLFNHVWDHLITEKRSQFCTAHKTPFTNCTFESMDKGLQMLTVPYHKENINVKLCLVDGYNAASQLEELHTISYEFLRQYIFEYAYKDKQGYSYKTRKTVLNVSNTGDRIVFAPYHLVDIRSQDFDIIASHTKNFNDLLKLPKNQWHIKVNAETLIILDNYRICWCIAEDHPNNELECFYMERRHYISSLQKLKQ